MKVFEKWEETGDLNETHADTMQNSVQTETWAQDWIWHSEAVSQHYLCHPTVKSLSNFIIWRTWCSVKDTKKVRREWRKKVTKVTTSVASVHQTMLQGSRAEEAILQDFCYIYCTFLCESYLLTHQVTTAFSCRKAKENASPLTNNMCCSSG